MEDNADKPNAQREIELAVEFLNCFHQKGCGVDAMKRYLKNKRGLTDSEIAEAFRLHKEKTGIAEKSSTVAEGVSSDTTDLFTKFLRSESRKEGKNLIHEFLEKEAGYCKVLQCLKETYYVQLIGMAGQNDFNMTAKEVKTIFNRIPTLYKFHENFYKKLNKGLNIGWMFVELFQFFSMYAEYMKDCISTVNLIRNYILDVNLQECLNKISNSSDFPEEEMIDLILIPLDRMMEYQEFLEKLYGFSDNSHETNYEFLGKAVRRIGRIATYIGAHIVGIKNRSEMNKAQMFFGKKNDILLPNRYIVRKGRLNCKVGGGVRARKSTYIFFLFNDALIFTKKKEDPPKVLKLWTCNVVKASSRKFKILTKGMIKVLNFECASEAERDEWVDAVEKTADRAQKSSAQTWSNFATNYDLTEEGLARQGSVYEDYNYVVTPSQSDNEEEKSDEPDLKVNENTSRYKSYRLLDVSTEAEDIILGNRAQILETPRCDTDDDWNNTGLPVTVSASSSAIPHFHDAKTIAGKKVVNSEKNSPAMYSSLSVLDTSNSGSPIVRRSSDGHIHRQSLSSTFLLLSLGDTHKSPLTVDKRTLSSPTKKANSSHVSRDEVRKSESKSFRLEDVADDENL